MEDNDLIKLLKKFPNENWNFAKLSTNPNITMKYIKKHPFEPWNWNSLSSNPGITLEDIQNNPKCHWNKNIIEARSIGENKLEKEILNFVNEMENLYTNIDDFDNYTNRMTTNNILYSSPPEMTLSQLEILCDIDDIPKIEIDDEQFINPEVGSRFNEEDLFHIMCNNHARGLKFKNDNPISKIDISWKSMKLLENNFYDWNALSKNINLQLKIIKKNLDKSWDWLWISRNVNLNIDFILTLVKNFIQLDWFWISQNPNITWQIIQSFPTLSWDIRGLRYNPNLTYEIIINEPKLWDFNSLSDNHFQKSKVLIESLEKKRIKQTKYWKYIIEMIFIY